MGSSYKTTNPVTGELVREYQVISDAEVEEAISAAFDAYGRWRATKLVKRIELLARIAELYRERQDELAATITLEMGKPITQARAEVQLVASIYDYYADNGERFLADERLEIAGAGEAFVSPEPIGPLLGIMPWNFPYYQVARFAAPNLLLGNTILLKHARNCPQAALAMEEIARQAGLPDGTYRNLFITSGQVANILADDRVRGVSLTGSERAGSAVAEVAGRHLKKYVLELGGSDPFVVLDGVDLDHTVRAAVNGRMYNGGQACTASKRIIVVGDTYEAFLEAFVPAMAAVRPGDPTDPETTFGPLCSQSAVDEIAELVDDAVRSGAVLRTGGKRLDGPGAFYEPTVLTGVTPSMRAYREELFGPVAVVHRVDSVEEAITLANDSPYGLGASVFGADIAQARAVAEQLETGMVWLNGISRSAPDLPFGGVKRSGVGRELARFGVEEFANKKLIRIP